MKTTLTHPKDPSLTFTLTPPSKDAWGDAWNTVSSARGKEAGTFTAGYNLMLACAESPSQSEIPTLVDDWPFLPLLAFVQASILAGQLTFDGPDTNAAGLAVNAWRFDLAATVKAAKDARGAAAPDDPTFGLDQSPAIKEAHGEALLALQASGLTLEACEDILSRYNRRGQLITIRTAGHGVIIVRRPRFQADVLTHANNVTSYGHYEAAERLAGACTAYPPNVAARFDDAPALATSLAKLANEMTQEGAGAAVKKE